VLSTTAEKLVESQAEVFKLLIKTQKNHFTKEKNLSSLKKVMASYFRQTFFFKNHDESEIGRG